MSPIRTIFPPYRVFYLTEIKPLPKKSLGIDMLLSGISLAFYTINVLKIVFTVFGLLCPESIRDIQRLSEAKHGFRLNPEGFRDRDDKIQDYYENLRNRNRVRYE